MTNKINSVLKLVLPIVKPSDEELKKIKAKLNGFLQKIEKNKRANRINAEIFVGGSGAKGTMIKKGSYDIDIFIRFDKKYKDSMLSDLTEKILRGQRFQRIHGSRNYFKVKADENLFFEIIPVKMIKNPKEAENVTDLSYSHVRYIKNKIKTQKILDEIRIAKAFCYANSAYGAESYVSGFSGYAIELLVYYYKNFINFIRAVSKFNLKNKGKIIIDIEKLHKNKSQILMDINEAKLKSPIILIDPTYKQRNVVAALSQETLEKFKKVCADFLKKPSVDFFRQKVVDIKKLENEAKKRSFEFLMLEMKTEKQAGDIAGSKMLKFHKYLISEMSTFFEIKGDGFEYKKGKTARAFYVVKKKGDILIRGPKVSDENNAKRFRLKHKIVFAKNGRLYSKVKVDYSLKEFMKKFILKNREKIGSMSITKLEIAE